MKRKFGALYSSDENLICTLCHCSKRVYLCNECNNNFCSLHIYDHKLEIHEEYEEEITDKSKMLDLMTNDDPYHFERASDELLHDKELINLYINKKIKGEFYRGKIQIREKFKRNKTFITELMLFQPFLVTIIHSDLIYDRNFMLDLVKLNHDVFKKFWLFNLQKKGLEIIQHYLDDEEFLLTYMIKSNKIPCDLMSDRLNKILKTNYNKAGNALYIKNFRENINKKQMKQFISNLEYRVGNKIHGIFNFENYDLRFHYKIINFC